MTHVLPWGQPLESIVQFAYVVEDAEAAALRYVERLGVGPWFLRGPFQPPAGIYRGSPTHATFEIAHAFSGGMMIELIAQHDSSPSVATSMYFFQICVGNEPPVTRVPCTFSM